MRFRGNSGVGGRDGQTRVLDGGNYGGGSLEVRHVNLPPHTALPTLTEGILGKLDLSVETVASSGRPGAERSGLSDRARESRVCLYFW